MSTQHIQRTWRYQRDKEGTGFVAHSYVWGPKVTVHCAGGDLNHTEPDMRLIAAAPELLEALQGLLADIVEYQTMNKLCGENNTWQVIARAAIAKATGGAA